MKDNKIINFLIPLIAVVIIFESVMLVSKLSSSNNKTSKIASMPAEKIAAIPDSQTNAFDLVFATDNKEMKLGKNYTVELNLLSKAEYKVDAASIYVNYDPKNFEISNLVPSDKFPKPTFIKNSSIKGVIVADYLISESNGSRLQKNQVISVLKFDIKPRKIGSFEFEISTGKEDKNSATMFIENATSKVLPFSSNKLIVNVLK